MDARTLQLAVALLGSLALLCVGGSIGLEAAGHPTPTFLSNLASASLGAIAGLVSLRPSGPPAQRLKH